jgi:S-adenosyl-L-methionine hydrolase (adenosine-forming)
MPIGVHLAFVDPGVGSARRPVALVGGDGRLYVGPDNGLLLVAAEKLGGVKHAVEIQDPRYTLEPMSATFHGRDLFSPVAAHLAAGVPLGDLGPEILVDELVHIDIPRAEVGSTRLRATVLYVDRFGNVQLNATSEDLKTAGIEPGTRVEIESGFEAYFAVAARTFTDVRPGEIVLYEDSYRNVALALNGGNAAEMLLARPGRELRVRRTDT